MSPGYVLNPAVVPVHDPALITTLPGRDEWYHLEGCAHLSVEAFWQMSKVIEVRYDRFLAARQDEVAPEVDVEAQRAEQDARAGTRSGATRVTGRRAAAGDPPRGRGTGRSGPR